MGIDGATTGDLFVAYARQVPVPAVRRGGVVAMGDLPCHERADTAAALERRAFQSTPESGGRAGYDGYKRPIGSKGHMV